MISTASFFPYNWPPSSLLPPAPSSDWLPSVRLIVMTSKNVTYLSPAMCPQRTRERDGNYYLLYLWGKLCRSISVSSDNECIQIYLYSHSQELCNAQQYFQQDKNRLSGLILHSPNKVFPRHCYPPYFHFLLWRRVSSLPSPHSISVTRSTAHKLHKLKLFLGVARNGRTSIMSWRWP